MEKEKLKELRVKGKALEPIIRIGKNGLTDEVIAQIVKILRKKKLIKVKFLKSHMESHDKKQAAAELCEKTRAELIDRTGFVAVIYKR